MTFSNIKDLFPNAADPCPVVKGVDCRIRWEIMGECTPFAAIVHQVEHGVYQVPFVMNAIRALQEGRQSHQISDIYAKDILHLKDPLVRHLPAMPAYGSP